MQGGVPAFELFRAGSLLTAAQTAGSIVNSVAALVFLAMTAIDWTAAD